MVLSKKIKGAFNMNNYSKNNQLHFKVSAKCGHVGKSYYYRGLFYVQAEDGKNAASIVRDTARVKHHHKHAILSVEKITFAEYTEGQQVQKNNPYFNCHNKQEQNFFYDISSNDIYPEIKKERKDNADRKSKLEKQHRFYRKMDKYGILLDEGLTI